MQMAKTSAAIKKHGQVYDFATIDKPDLVSFARKRFQAAGIDITPGGINALIDATGYYHKESDYRLFHFENDIQKIIAHSDGMRMSEKQSTNKNFIITLQYIEIIQDIKMANDTEYRKGDRYADADG